MRMMVKNTELQSPKGHWDHLLDQSTPLKPPGSTVTSHSADTVTVNSAVFLYFPSEARESWAAKCLRHNITVSNKPTNQMF